MKHLSLTIGWLYPDLMSTYGDRGNIICLVKRCEWRDINVEIKEISLNTEYSILNTCDLLFMGGAQDRQQKIAAEDLRKNKGPLIKQMINEGVPGLFICGAYQFMGYYYKPAEGEKISGLGIFDLHTVHPGKEKGRCIGNVVIEIPNRHSGDPPAGGDSRIPLGCWTSSSTVLSSLPKGQHNEKNKHFDNYLVGFENHGGRTYLGKGVEPLGRVVVGFGNNGEDGTEGCIYKNAIGSYLHGPILPKNPHLADWLIKMALSKKYGCEVKLKEIDDGLEWQARKFMLNKLNI